MNNQTNEKSQYFHGIKFSKNEDTGYYFNRVVRRTMHRYVWEYYNGKIPAFCQVHHIDGDKSNNSIENLELLKSGEHQKQHWQDRSEAERKFYGQFLDNEARKKAKEWHGSTDGHEWHKKHYDTVKKKMYNANIARPLTQKTCINCGSTFDSKNARRFCSNKCRSQWRRKAGLDTEVRTCSVCGKQYETRKDSQSNTCSQSCANIMWHQKSKGIT